MLKVLCLATMVVHATSLGAAAPTPLAKYRAVTLGDSVAFVSQQLQLAAADVKVLYKQPSLVQEATWRPHRFVSGTEVAPDPLAALVLTFHQDRLALAA